MKIFKSKVSRYFPQKITLEEVLKKMTGLEEVVLGEAAQKGAVWIQRAGKGKILRIRSLREVVSPEDVIEFNYDLKVLRIPDLTQLEAIYEDANYGVWHKPAGVVPQGSPAGDHASLLRYVEKKRKSEVFLVHRIDRETAGLMIIAYHSKSAAYFSDLFQKHKVTKTYEAVVLGALPLGKQESISASLDGKGALTHYEVLESKDNRSLLKVIIETGRLHQIRRHLDFIGHPVMGDPKYGKGNKNRDGLKLLASELSFEDPWLKKVQTFSVVNHLTI